MTRTWTKWHFLYWLAYCLYGLIIRTCSKYVQYSTKYLHHVLFVRLLDFPFSLQQVEHFPVSKKAILSWHVINLFYAYACNGKRYDTINISVQQLIFKTNFVFKKTNAKIKDVNIPFRLELFSLEVSPSRKLFLSQCKFVWVFNFHKRAVGLLGGF